MNGSKNPTQPLGEPSMPYYKSALLSITKAAAETVTTQPSTPECPPSHFSPTSSSEEKGLSAHFLQKKSQEHMQDLMDKSKRVLAVFSYMRLLPIIVFEKKMQPRKLSSQEIRAKSQKHRNNGK